MEKQSGKRIVQLDYIKAISILMVVVTHCAFTTADRERPIFVFLINMAMPLFMLVYGYVRTMTDCKKQANRKSKAVAWIKKTYNILIPACIAFVIELCLMYLFNGHLPADLLRLLWEEGGIGPGSYYVPILLQLLILYPILQACFRKKSIITTAAAVVLFLAFEILAGRFVDDKLYRLLCFRYLPFIVAGMNMAKYRGSLRKWKNSIFALSVVSFVWLYLVVYRDYQPRIFTRWTTTAGPVVFLAMSIMIVFLLYMKPLKGIFGRLLSEIGQSSYYIFLTQLVWFGVPLSPQSLTGLPAIVLNLIFTVYFGIVFKRIERYIYKKIFAHPQKTN